MLHELCVWLLARLLRVPTNRDIRIPASQDISELRLNFVRLSPRAGRLRAFAVSVAPMATGVFALWLLAESVFRRDVALAESSGGVDGLLLALGAVLRATDFWLWFYLAFVIANTMFPTAPVFQSWRTRVTAIGGLAITAWLAWRFDAATVDALLRGLGFALLPALSFDLLVLAALGAVESIIERLTGKSATFADGKLIAMTREEARARRQQAPGKTTPETPAPTPKVAHSIYDLPLPIPGPPGREPISRSAVAVVMRPAPEPEPPPQPAPPPTQPSQSIADIRAKEDAPFSRPFAPGDDIANEELWQEDEAPTDESAFARPFASDEPAPPAAASPPRKNRPARPVPKPASAAPRLPASSAQASDELTYEPLDDVDMYPDEDERYPDS